MTIKKRWLALKLTYKHIYLIGGILVMSNDITSLLMNNYAPQLSSGWGNTYDPTGFGNGATGLFGNVLGTNALANGAMSRPMPPFITMLTQNVNIPNSGYSSGYLGNELYAPELSDAVTLAGILGSEYSTNNYNTLGIAGNSNLASLANQMGFNSSGTPDISALSALLFSGSLNVDFTGIDFRGFNLSNTNMANVLLGLMSGVNGPPASSYNPFGNVNNPIWGYTGNWGDTSSGLYSNIHDVNTVNLLS
jgi:hypothetical protein